MKNSADTPFPQWLREQLTRSGYDVTGQRSGGRSRFAEDSGISPSTVGRLLRGEGSFDTRVLATLAETLGVPLGEVLIRAGVVTPDDLTTVRTPHAGPRNITPEQAADELGINDDQARRLFVSMVETLQRDPSGEERLADQ